MPPTKPDVNAFADELMQMIDEGIADGLLPSGVNCFSDLHSYTDANMYLEDAGVPYDATPATIDVIVDVQEEVTRRLRAPGRPHCRYGACDFTKHDHSTAWSDWSDDQDVDEPLQCKGCGQSAHYDLKLKDFRHDDPATPDCSHIHPLTLGGPSNRRAG